MYASPEQRAAGIATGHALPADELRSWLTDSAHKLAAGLDGLTDEQWLREVVTAQGRTVPATELPWMRAPEVCVHAVDLGTGAVTFAGLPKGLLTALVAEISAKRDLTVRPGGRCPRSPPGWPAVPTRSPTPPNSARGCREVTPMSHPDVIVAGGGIGGLGVAYSLTRQGQSVPPAAWSP